MQRTVALVSGFILLIVGISAAPATAADAASERVDRIVAKANPRLLEVVVTTSDDDGKPSFKTVKVPDIAGAKRVVAQYAGQKGVDSVEMNQLRRPTALNDPLYKYQWALKAPSSGSPSGLNMPKIYSIVGPDKKIPIVAVVDTGVRADHPDLLGRVRAGYNVNGGSSDDECGHGTHVAGIIAARGGNAIGGLGLSSRAQILPVKFLSYSLLYGECTGTSSGSANAIMWAATHGAMVINASFTGPYSQAEASAVAYAISHGVMVVAAAGNSGQSLVEYPAGYSGVIGVGAVDMAGQKASFSSTGGHVDIAAPGVLIVSTMTQSNTEGCGTTDYCYLNGTSMATPFVAASAAMAMVHCGWSRGTTEYYLRARARRFAGGNYPNPLVGYGLLNPVALLAC